MNIDKEEFLEIRKLAQETHDAVIELRVQFRTFMNGGPGTWESCKVHDKILEKHEATIIELAKRVNMGMGAVGFVSLIAAVASVIAVFLKK